MEHSIQQQNYTFFSNPHGILCRIDSQLCRKLNQHTSEQPMGQKGNQKGNQNIMKQTKIETQHTKTYGMQ